jgi:membrane protease YdiL (CAAX protease family)
MAIDPDSAASDQKPVGSGTVDLKAVFLFYGVAYALGIAIASPLWKSGQGLLFPNARLLLTLMMYAPAVGVLAVRFLLPGSVKPIVRSTGLGLGHRSGALGYWLFSWLGLTLLGLACPFVSHLFGLLRLDLQNYSGYRELLLARLAGPILERYSIQAIVLFQLASLLIAPLFNAIFTFGEEWGWRGFLLPKLLPLGQWQALIWSGTLWGLWHAPVVLLGYDYPFHPKLGLLFMTVFCVIYGILLGWLRLATASIWPAVFAHGATNAVGEFTYVVAASGQKLDTAHVTILGWTGWILPLLLILALVLLKRLPVPDPK